MELLLPIIGLIFIFIIDYFSVHIFGNKVWIYCSSYKRKITSFCVGFTLIYLFAEFLPHVYQSPTSVYSVVLGFSIFLCLEQLVVKYRKRSTMSNNEQTVHAYFIFIVKLLQGIIIFQVLEQGFGAVASFLITIVTVDMAEDFSVHFLKGREKGFITYFLPLGLLIGFIIAILNIVSIVAMNWLSGFTPGILLYLIVTELIPKERQRSGEYLILGMLIYILLQIFI